MWIKKIPLVTLSLTEPVLSNVALVRNNLYCLLSLLFFLISVPFEVAQAQAGGALDPAGPNFDLLIDNGQTIVGPSNPVGDLPELTPRAAASSFPPPILQEAPLPSTNPTDIPLGVVGNFNFDEPLVRVNPTNRLNVVATSHRGIRPSVDGGASYAATVFYPTTLGSSNGDTAMAFDSQGRLFWANLVNVASPDFGNLQVMRVNPLTGASLTTPVNVQIASADPVDGFDDKEFMAADEYSISSFTDNLYMIWTKFGATTDVFFSRSINQAVGWSAPMQLSQLAEGFPWPSDVAVAPNGDVYAAYHSGGQSGAVGDTWVLRSTDGGVTFPQKNRAFLPGQNDVTYNVQSLSGSIPLTQFWMQGSVQPWLLPDPARPGQIYVVSNDDPDNSHGSGDDADVVIARSTDNGSTWAFSTIPDGSGGAHQVFPFAAIDETGNIAVAWYDTRRGLTNGFGRLLLDVFATYSTDGGITWATAFMVNDPNNPFDPDFPDNQRRFPEPQFTPCAKSVNSTETCRIGEYFGIDIHRGTAHVTWVGNTFDSVGAVTGDQQWIDSFSIPTDLSVAKSSGVESADPGKSVSYIIVVANGGASDDPAASLVDNLPSDLTCTYTSVAAGGASGNTAGSGDLAETLSLPPGSYVTYTVSCTIDSFATGILSNTATITASVPDTVPGNNSATDDTRLTKVSMVPAFPGWALLLLMTLLASLGAWFSQYRTIGAG